MEQHGKFVGVGMAIAMMTLVAGCGTAATGNHTTTSNNTTGNNTANTSGAAPTNTSNNSGAVNQTNSTASTATQSLAPLSYSANQKQQIVNAAGEFSIAPYIPMNGVQGDSFISARPGGFPSITLTYHQMVIDESNQSVTTGETIQSKKSVTLSNGTVAQWITTGSTSGPAELTFQIGSLNVGIQPNAGVSQSAIEQIAVSMQKLVVPVSYQSETLTLQPGTTVTFKVPQGWNKQNGGAGDTGMTTWVNPMNANQWVRVMFSGNVGALQNPNTGTYDVTTYINTQAAKWTSVSSDKLTGQFTLPAGTINNKTLAYGFAQVVTKPNPLGVAVEAVAPQSVAHTIAGSVSVKSK